MTAVPRPKLTPAEYLARERRAEFKSEYLNGETFAMAGASYAHNLIKDNLVAELSTRLRGGPCRTLSSDMRVKVSRTGLYTYPDVLVLCGPPEFEDNERDTLLNPRVVIEVLSYSTEKYDRGAKFRHYQQVPSLQEYVLVSQDEPVVEHFARRPDGTWVLTTAAGLDGELTLATVPARVPLAAVYAGVTFPDHPSGPPDNAGPR